MQTMDSSVRFDQTAWQTEPYSCEIDMRKSGVTAHIVDTLRRRITTGTLTRGEKLPSIRGLAARNSVSPSTIVEVYERLGAEGLITARPGSGYYVRETALQDRPCSPRRYHAMDPFWVSRQALEADPAIMQPGCGWLPEAWMPNAALSQALRSIAKEVGPVMTGYGPAMGDQALREVLSRRWAEMQFFVPSEQILLTGSGTQAVDLVCRVMLKPGDCVIVDDPCYFNFRALLDVHRVRVVGVPYGAEGPDIVVLGQILEQHSPRLYLTNSAIQNPTGGSLSLNAAHRILTLAQNHPLTIVEDDIFSDFAPQGTASLGSLDGLSRVIRVGSFSKTLSASLRCGYIAAKPEIIEALGDLQIATGFSGVSPVAASVVRHVLTGGAYRRHLDTLFGRLARARRECANRLAAIGIVPEILPRGGFTLWCRLPEGRDASALARLALEEGIVLAPGAVFSVSGSATTYMRFNVTQMADPEIFLRLGALMACLSPGSSGASVAERGSPE